MEHSEDDGANELAKLYASMTTFERVMLWTFIIIKLYAFRVISQAFGILVGVTFFRCVDCDRRAIIAISVGILAHIYAYMSLRVLATRNA